MTQPPKVRKDPEKHRDQVRRANRARSQAMKELISRHRVEYETLYQVIAAEWGVEARPRDTTDAETLERQIAELRQRLDRTRQKGGG